MLMLLRLKGFLVIWWMIMRDFYGYVLGVLDDLGVGRWRAVDVLPVVVPMQAGGCNHRFIVDLNLDLGLAGVMDGLLFTLFEASGHVAHGDGFIATCQVPMVKRTYDGGDTGVIGHSLWDVPWVKVDFADDAGFRLVVGDCVRLAMDYLLSGKVATQYSTERWHGWG